MHGLIVQIRTDEDQFADLVDEYYSVFGVQNTDNVNINVYFSHNTSWSEKQIAIETSVLVMVLCWRK